MRKLCTLLGVLALASAPATALASGNPHGSSGQSSSHAGGNSAKSSGTSTASSHAQGNASTTGTYTSPQPPSRADQNSGGANGGCPGTTKGDYCSTRNGSPSMNGNGKGKATGKPCAGCVGKADNKNPKGQYPNGSDHNSGYECDGNHGIGRTNPAHTGCTTNTTPPATCTGGSASSNCSTTPPATCTGGSTSSNCSTTPPCTNGTMTPPNNCTPSTPPCTSGSTMSPPKCTTGSVSPTFGARKPSGAVRGIHATRRPGAERPTSSKTVPSTIRRTTPHYISLTTTKTKSSGTLPFTGLDLLALVLVGGLLIGLGLVQRRVAKGLR